MYIICMMYIIWLYFTGSLKDLLDPNCLKSLEQLANEAKCDVILPSGSNKNTSPHNSPIKMVSRHLFFPVFKVQFTLHMATLS